MLIQDVNQEGLKGSESTSEQGYATEIIPGGPRNAYIITQLDDTVSRLFALKVM